MKRTSSIQIHNDGQFVWTRTEGDDRDVCHAITTAAFEHPVIRASVLNAAAEIFEKKNPALARQILLAMEQEAPSPAGRKAQLEKVKKLIAA